MPEPFNIAVPDERLHSIRARLEAFDWSALPDAGGWESGVGIADLRRLVDYWLRRYDWRVQEARLNRLDKFTAEVPGQRLNFIHARGDGDRKSSRLNSSHYCASRMPFSASKTKPTHNDNSHY